MKGITDASPEKRQDKEKRELERLKCEQARPKGSGYMIYFIMIITVIYIADEVTSQIGTQMQTILADQIFAPVFGAEYAVARMSTLGMITVVFGILAFLYKPLSDRFGRKIFLVINTLGMGLGMVLQFLDLLKDVDVYSEITGKELQKRLYQYMSDTGIRLSDMEPYFSYYPDKLYRNLVEAKVIYYDIQEYLK